ncbi:MAG: hypothetical protein WAK17_00420 [Candidatus Nitrosopolaris sp.]
METNKTTIISVTQLYNTESNKLENKRDDYLGLAVVKEKWATKVDSYL